MDDQMNQGSMPANPAQGTDIGAQSPVFQTPSPMPPPPPMGGLAEEHPHEQILAALARIEEKLAAIAAKVGA